MPLTQTDRTRLVDILKGYGARWIALFGSTARGEDTPESDVDVLVRFSRGVSLLTMVGIEQELSDAIGRKVDLLTEAAISPFIRPRIESDLQVIYEA